MSASRLASLPEGTFLHNWQADPFARGAYSYIPTGALEAQALLAQPLAGALVFAGEALTTDELITTVHGAIGSGRRAARVLLEQRTGRPEAG